MSSLLDIYHLNAWIDAGPAWQIEKTAARVRLVEVWLFVLMFIQVNWKFISV